MIKLVSNNPLLLSSINNLLLQEKLFPVKHSSFIHTTIAINTSQNQLLLRTKNEMADFNLPVDLNLLLSKIMQITSDIKFQIGIFDYFPYQRTIYSRSKKLLLTDIQNIILSNLIVSKEGINKISLYKSIWDKDKNIFINKLDTHLTNLKNQLIKDLDMKVTFQSQDKILKLLVN